MRNKSIYKGKRLPQYMYTLSETKNMIVNNKYTRLFVFWVRCSANLTLIDNSP